MLVFGGLPVDPAWALGNDTIFASATVGITRDDNLYRLAPQVNSPAVLRAIGVSGLGDTLYNYGVGLNFNFPYARQSFEGNFNANITRFENNPSLNYTATQASTIWHWTLGHEWTGDLGFTNNRVIQGFQGLTTAAAKNIISVTDLRAAATDAIDDRWSSSSTLEYTERANGNAQFQSGDQNVVSLQQAIQYALPSGSRLGVRARLDDSVLPNQQVSQFSVTDNRYTEMRLAATGSWAVSAKTGLSGELGVVQRQHPDVPERNFSGFTGLFSYNYAVTGRWSLSANGGRDIGGSGDLVQVYARTYQAGGNSVYELASKTVWRAGVQYNWSHFQGNTGFLPAFLDVYFPERQDRVGTYSTSIVYSPTRNSQLGASMVFIRRTSTVAGFDYTDLTSSLTATLQF